MPDIFEKQATLILDNLRVGQRQIENSLRTIPEQLAMVYEDFIAERKGPKMINLGEDESGFFLIINCSLFPRSAEADAQKCQEFAESLFEERVIIQYIEKLGFIKYYKVQKLNSLQMNHLENDEEENMIRGPPRRHHHIDIPQREKKPIIFEDSRDLYHMKDIIHTFAINPLNTNQFAIGTNNGILELDTEYGTELLREFPEGSTNSSLPLKPHLPPFPHIHIPNPLRKTKSGVKEKDKLKKSKEKLEKIKRKLEKSEKMISKSTTKSPNITRNVGNRNPAVHALCAHPHNPYYLSGSSNGVVLWQYKVPTSIVSYRAVATSKFVACDHSGAVSLWRMSFLAESVHPYRLQRSNRHRTL